MCWCWCWCVCVYVCYRCWNPEFGLLLLRKCFFLSYCLCMSAHFSISCSIRMRFYGIFRVANHNPVGYCLWSVCYRKQMLLEWIYAFKHAHLHTHTNTHHITHTQIQRNAHTWHVNNDLLESEINCMENGMIPLPFRLQQIVDCAFQRCVRVRAACSWIHSTTSFSLIHQSISILCTRLARFVPNKQKRELALRDWKPCNLCGNG